MLNIIIIISYYYDKIMHIIAYYGLILSTNVVLSCQIVETNKIGYLPKNNMI